MFKQLEILGNEKEVSKIVNKTIESLETNYKIKISHEQLIPAFVNCFMDAFYFKSIPGLHVLEIEHTTIPKNYKFQGKLNQKIELSEEKDNNIEF